MVLIRTVTFILIGILGIVILMCLLELLAATVTMAGPVVTLFIVMMVLVVGMVIVGYFVNLGN